MQVDPSPLQMTFRQPLLVIRRNLYWPGDSGGLAVVVVSFRSVERIDLKICNMNMNVVVIIYIYIYLNMYKPFSCKRVLVFYIFADNSKS